MEYNNATPVTVVDIKGPIKVVDNRTTIKDNNKNQTTKIICDQNSNKIKLASEKT